MPRRKEYDREAVIARATDVFWDRGFARTSIDDLVDACGIHRRSMYEEFGGKESLFLECMAYYGAHAGSAFGELLSREPKGLANLEALVQERARAAAAPGDRGCLVINTTVEQRHISLRVRRKIRQSLDTCVQLLRENLVAAQQAGEIEEDRDSEALAKMLMCLVQGIMVMGRSGSRTRDIEAVANQVLDTIRG